MEKIEKISKNLLKYLYKHIIIQIVKNATDFEKNIELLPVFLKPGTACIII